MVDPNRVGEDHGSEQSVELWAKCGSDLRVCIVDQCVCVWLYVRAYMDKVHGRTRITWLLSVRIVACMHRTGRLMATERVCLDLV